MGHRALVAYERTDGTYNLHYSHWGACNLRLKHRITEATPYGSDCPAQWAREAHQSLTDGAAVEIVRERYNIDGSCPGDVDPLPQATGVTLEDALVHYLDYLMHEAFYVVDLDFAVTAYRTLWLGLQYECETIEDQPTVGYGAIRTVRWYDGEPVGDGHAQGHFAGMKRVVGQLVDRGVFDAEAARAFLIEQLTASVGDGDELYFGTVE